ncbi:predicted protein [Naegleria gruberi]|uniref:Predicted protein n=1 Tax=Naegleria gruberi TaxID=5762 RepID=D2W4B8_NAEGR|nr:uncharacterized protein NAEGRDRAFT_76249 [Naegleria gruberi]EFC36083.1 predicted protein [Naegleria gruberi]|eukprot:XP_002668827.1 predicted protein [Naegleria gruberi strain NEG-M]
MSDDNLSVVSGNTTLMIDDEIQDETLKSFLQCNCKTCLEMYHKSSSDDIHSIHSKANLSSIHNHHHHEASHNHHHLHCDDLSSHHFSHHHHSILVDDQQHKSDRDILSNLDALTVMSVHTTRSHPMFPSNIYDDCLSEQDDIEEGRRSFHKLTNNFKFNDDLEFNDDEVDDKKKPFSKSEKETFDEFDSEKKLDESLNTTRRRTIQHVEDDFMNIDNEEETIERVEEEMELIIDDNIEEEEPVKEEEEICLEFEDLKSECRNETVPELEFEEDEEINKKECIQQEGLQFQEDELVNDNVSTGHVEQHDEIVTYLDEEVESIVGEECKLANNYDDEEQLNASELDTKEEQLIVQSPIIEIDQYEGDEIENQTLVDTNQDLIETNVLETVVQDRMEDDDISIEISIEDFPEIIQPIQDCEEIILENNQFKEKSEIIECFINGYLERRRFNANRELLNNIQARWRQNSVKMEMNKVVEMFKIIQTLVQSAFIRKDMFKLKNTIEPMKTICKGTSVRNDMKNKFEMIETIQSLLRGEIYRKYLQNEKNNQMITDDFCYSPNTMFDNIPSSPVQLEKIEHTKRTAIQVSERNSDDERVKFFPPPLPKPFRLSSKENPLKKPKKEPKIEKELVIYNSKPIQNYGKISMIRHEIKRKNDEFYFDQIEETRDEEAKQLNTNEEEEEPIIVIQPKKKMKMSKPSQSSTPIFKRLDLTDDEIDQLILQKDKLFKLEGETKILKEKEE